LNEPVYDEKGFPLVRILGITGSPGQYNAIVSVNGAQKLLKEGNTVAGYTEVARIEKDRMLLKNPTGDTKTVAF
jgi:type II secretory pathway component PulC